MSLLGIDLGTTAVKLAVVEPGVGVVARAAEPYPAIATRPGQYEQQPREWWAAVGRAAARLTASGHSLRRVTAVGLSGQTHGAVLLDGDYEPVRPCLTWADQRAVDETRELDERVGVRVRRRCGNRVLEAFTLPKLLWLARHEPEALRAAAHLGLPKDYLRRRLTGTWGTDETDAASTLLYDVVERRWDPELAAVTGVALELLPPVGAPSDLAGAVTPEAAAATGLPAGTPVVAGASDVACAALGAGADEPGLTYVNLGTAAQLMTPVPEPMTGAAHTFLGAGRERYLAMTSVYAAGRSVEWFVDDLCQGPVGRWPAADRHALIASAVAAVPPGSRGLLFLPHLLGASTPWFDAGARAALLGMTPSHGQADALRAVIEGVALAIRVSLDELAAGGVVDRIRLGGGPARSEAWTRILADACAADVEVLGGDSSALGAALLAGIGAQVFANPADAVASCVRVERTVTPDPDAVAVYTRHATVFREAYDALAPVFRRLTAQATPVGA